MTQLVLSSSEIRAITGYAMPCKQLAALHAAGYVRARRSHAGEIILERDHYHAVCCGDFERHQPRSRQSARLDFLCRVA
jgi:Domain of unknown function (DUF4224)